MALLTYLMSAVMYVFSTCIGWRKTRPPLDQPRLHRISPNAAAPDTGRNSAAPSIVCTETSQHSDARDDDEGEPMISRFIDGFVEVEFAGKHVGRSMTPLRLEWTGEEQYGLVKQEAKRILADRFTPVPQRRRLGGSVRLCKRRGDGFSTTIKQKNVTKAFQWYRFMRTIAGEYGRINESEDLYLEVSVIYDKSILELPGDTVAAKAWEAIERGLSNGWGNGEEDAKFLPQSMVNSIFSPLIVKKLAEEMENGDTAMRRRIHDLGLNILACCVYGKSMGCLFKLIKEEWTNAHMPIELTGYDFKGFKDNQFRFAVLDFATVVALLDDETSSQLQTDPDSGKDLPGILKKISRKGNYFYVKHDVVIPITAEQTIGEGGYGFVYRVRIYKEYHTFTEDMFALKVFFDNVREEAFEEESTVLAELKLLRHDHIVVPKASWQHRGRFYMLLPLAENDLKTHLRSSRPSRTPDFFKQLLKQLMKLAEAIEVIHSMKGSQLFEKSPGNLPQPSTPPHLQRRTGFHHDLKPANILIFPDGSWKINDFGTAKISSLVSGGTSRQVRSDSKDPRGDPEYRAPDEESSGGLSRPYDIWAFGCIILEVLVWVFDDGLDPVNEFQRKRWMPNIPNEAYATFWYREGDELKLKPAVEECLSKLLSWTQDWGVFKELVLLVQRMLAIKTRPHHLQPKEMVRPHAAEVRRMLETFTRQVEAMEDLYQEPGRRPGRTERSVFRDPTISFYSDRSRTHSGSRSGSPSPSVQSSQGRGDLPASPSSLAPDPPTIPRQQNSRRQTTSSVRVSSQTIHAAGAFSAEDGLGRHHRANSTPEIKVSLHDEQTQPSDEDEDADIDLNGFQSPGVGISTMQSAVSPRQEMNPADFATR